MDLLKRFFLVSFNLLVGVTIVVLSKDYGLFAALTIIDSEIICNNLHYKFQLILAMTVFCRVTKKGPFRRNISMLQLPIVKYYGQITLGIFGILLSDLTPHRVVPQ